MNSETKDNVHELYNQHTKETVRASLMILLGIIFLLGDTTFGDENPALDVLLLASVCIAFTDAIHTTFQLVKTTQQIRKTEQLRRNVLE